MVSCSSQWLGYEASTPAGRADLGHVAGLGRAAARIDYEREELELLPPTEPDGRARSAGVLQKEGTSLSRQPRAGQPLRSGVPLRPSQPRCLHSPTSGPRLP